MDAIIDSLTGIRPINVITFEVVWLPRRQSGRVGQKVTWGGLTHSRMVQLWQVLADGPIEDEVLILDQKHHRKRCRKRFCERGKIIDGGKRCGHSRGGNGERLSTADSGSRWRGPLRLEAFVCGLAIYRDLPRLFLLE